MVKKKGLGKGLDALFADNNTEDGVVTSLRIVEIEPNKTQPRTAFEEESLRELADSIRQHGVIQPLVVRPLEAGGYQIVAGERRWRAARMAGLSEMPVVIRELNDMQTLEIAIIENLQREDLNVMELARGYKSLMERYSMTQEQIAEKMGKSRPAIANTLRLLGLPERVQAQVAAGEVSAGHAKALLSLEDSALIEQTAQRIAGEGLPVRDVEKLAQQRKQQAASGEKPSRSKQEATWGDNFYKEMEIALSTELGRKVKITPQGKKALLQIEFYSNEELADIAARLAKADR